MILRPCTLASLLLIPACGGGGGDATESGASTGGSSTTADSTTDTPTTGGPTTGDGSGESTGDPSTGEPTTGDPLPVACAAVVGEHAAAVCPGGACPITTDLELRCDDDEFAAPGLQVGPAPDATWIVTASGHDAMLFKADVGGAERITGVVEPYPRSTFLMALGSDGSPHLAVDGTVFYDDYVGGLLHISLEGDEWISSPLYDAPDHGVPPIDLAVDAMGRPHLFYASEPPELYSVAVRDGGMWTAHDITTPEPGTGNRFSVTAAGEEVAYAIPQDRLLALVGGETVEVGPPVASRRYRPASSAPVGPDLAAALTLTDSLAVAWASLGTDPTPGGVVEVPGTAPLSGTCGSGPPGQDPDEPCPGSCHDTSVGMEANAFAFARTDDGLGWLAWVVTRLDVTYHFELSQFDDVEFFCQALADTNLSTGELHLARIPLEGGAPEEVLVMPLARLAGDVFGDLYTPSYPVEMGAFGRDVAIAVRLAESDTAFVRVLRLDTTAFE